MEGSNRVYPEIKTKISEGGYKMGFRVIIMIAVLLIITSVVIISLSRSQMKSTEETAEQVLLNHAKNIANANAQQMLADLVAGFGSASSLPADRNFTDVVEAPNSIATVSVYTKASYSEPKPVLEDDDYIIVSEVEYDIEGGRRFTYRTEVIYEHLKETKSNYLPAPNNPTPNFNSNGSSTAARLDGNLITFFEGGGNAGTSAWGSIGSTPVPVYSENDNENRPAYFEQFDYVIVAEAPFRLIGNGDGSPVKGINKSIMIFVPGDVIIETNIFPAAGSDAKIVIQATGDIHIGTQPPNQPRPITRVEADLYARGKIGPAFGAYANLNSKPNANVIQNSGGNAYPDQSTLYWWDVNGYPTGPNDPGSWEMIDYDVSVLRSWQEKTDVKSN